jgi:3-methyladenine DNA glycosylase AlkD
MREKIKKELKKYASRERADHSARFFKTGKGEYSEGDLFLGISNPDIYRVANKYKKEITLEDVIYFLRHQIHDYRILAIDILKYKYQKGDDQSKKEIVDIYLRNKEHINNWDLVDISAPHILGDWLIGKDKNILYELMEEDSLWSKRIAIISTFAFIRNEEYEDTLKLSEKLLDHEHDLIHKAVGWMLREVWKRDKDIAETFIKKHYKNIPRTALRYAIEKMEESKRQRFLKGDI